MEVLAFIVVGGWRELDGAKVDLTVNHLNFALAANSNIKKGELISAVVVPIFLDGKELSLSESKST